MNNLNNLLQPSASKDLFQFVSSCSSIDDLVAKLANDFSKLLDILQNIKVEGNENLAARLLVKIDSSALENAEVKKVETALRNGGMLKRTLEPDIIVKEEEGISVEAHRVILSLESNYFQAIKGFKESGQNKLIIKDMDISPEAYQTVIDYLYFSDEKRKEFLSLIDKSLLIDIAKLADFWEIKELKECCDDELCNSLQEFNIDKSDIKDWLSQSTVYPKFAKLLEFINRVSDGRDFGSLIESMQTQEGAAQLVAQCTPQEIAVFATLKTVFGKACQIPPGTFGKAEWEKTFPVRVVGDIPPLPSNIHAILELEDPDEPGKKIKRHLQAILAPRKGYPPRRRLRQNTLSWIYRSRRTGKESDKSGEKNKVYHHQLE